MLNARYRCHVTGHCLQNAASDLKVKYYWKDSIQIVELAHRIYHNQNIAQPISWFGGNNSGE